MAPTSIISSVLLTVVHAGPDYEKLWDDFKVDFDKTFNGRDDETYRFSVFKANVDFIELENAKELGYTLGITKFADWTHDEFKAMAKGVPAHKGAPKGNLGTHRWRGQDLPGSVNWTASGAVTPVKDQGSCGSCWAFSTTGVLEGANFVETGKLVSLAEDQILECATQYSMGCQGGFPNDGLKYATENAVCASEGYWPYLHSPGCVSNNCSKTGIGYRETVGFVDVPRDSEEDLMSAVLQQPVSVCIEADQAAFQHYKSGIVTSGCGTNLDHAVLATGYGTEDGTDYWLIKNSWGSKWGEQGYIRLGRGVGGPKGVCGVLDNAVYPVVKTFPAPVAQDEDSAAEDSFAQGVAVLYQGIDRSLGQNGQVGIYSVDLASKPCCQAELLQRITDKKQSRHDSRYAFDNRATMTALSATEACAVVSNGDGDTMLLQATRAEDGLSANITVASKVAYTDPARAAIGVDAAGQKVALYAVHSGSLMFKKFNVCIGSVEDTGTFSKKHCEKFDTDLSDSVRSLDGHVSTTLWDSARKRIVMIANNCKDGLCWGDSHDHWFPWTADPTTFSQSIIYATADLSAPAITQQQLESLPADSNNTWYPRKCDVSADGNYLCLVWSGQKSGFAVLNADEFSWSAVQESKVQLHDFAIVDGKGVATDVANGIWTFSDLSSPKPQQLGTLVGDGLETRAPVGRLWSFGPQESSLVV